MGFKYFSECIQHSTVDTVSAQWHHWSVQWKEREAHRYMLMLSFEEKVHEFGEHSIKIIKYEH